MLDSEVNIDNRKILAVIALVALLTALVVTLTSGLFRILLGLPFVLFIPGYALISALFPARNKLCGVERVGLSFGLSIVVVSLIALILNYTSWGIRLYPMVISVTIFIVIASAVGWYRQQRLPAADRFGVGFTLGKKIWAKHTKLEKVLFISLTVAILVAIGVLGYTIATFNQHDEQYTEFYVLNLEGEFGGYPKQVTLGQSVDVLVDVVNHERQPTSYRILSTIDGIKNSEVYAGILANGEKFQKEVRIVPSLTGNNQKAEFSLYKNDELDAYYEDPLSFNFDVVDAG